MLRRRYRLNRNVIFPLQKHLEGIQVLASTALDRLMELWVAMLVVVYAGVSSSSIADGAMLYFNTGQLNALGDIRLPDDSTGYFELPANPIFQYAARSSDQEAKVGLYFGFERTAAYLAIADGSFISQSPPDVLGNDGDYHTAILEVHSRMEWILYSPFDAFGYTQYNPASAVFLSLQYQVSGFLTPGSEVYVSSAARLYNPNNGSIRAQAGHSETWNQPGEFSLSFQGIALLSTFTPGAFDGWGLDYFTTVHISSPHGSAQSWAILDPGAASGTDSQNLFPWLHQAPQPVPEPNTCSIMGSGLLLLALGQWTSRFVKRKESNT